MSDAETRRLSAQIAAHARAAKYPGKELTAAAVAGAWKKYLDLVDPDRELDEEERLRRAESARRADMQRLVLARHKRERAAKEALLAADDARPEVSDEP